MLSGDIEEKIISMYAKGMDENDIAAKLLNGIVEESGFSAETEDEVRPSATAVGGDPPSSKSANAALQDGLEKQKEYITHNKRGIKGKFNKLHTYKLE